MKKASNNKKIFIIAIEVIVIVLTFIGVTGTNGKTTTCFLTYDKISQDINLSSKTIKKYNDIKMFRWASNGWIKSITSVS